MLTYCIEALELTKSAVNSIGVGWNDAFRKIYGMHRWESVTLIQWFCNELSFQHLYDLSRWNFLSGVFVDGSAPASVVFLHEFVKFESNVVNMYSSSYKHKGITAFSRKLAVKQFFEQQCLSLL